MTIKQPTTWNRPLGQTADVEEIQDQNPSHVSFNDLFPKITEVSLKEGGIPPTRTEFNTLFNLIGAHLYFLQQGGKFEYSSDREYPQYAIVLYKGELWYSLKEVSGIPPSEGIYWSKVVNQKTLDAELEELSQYSVQASEPAVAKLKTGEGVFYPASDLISVTPSGGGGEADISGFSNMEISETTPDASAVKNDYGVIYPAEDKII